MNNLIVLFITFALFLNIDNKQVTYKVNLLETTKRFGSNI